MQKEQTGTNIYSVRSLTYIAVASILITLCSWITIPVGPVPFTLQTFAVFAVVMTLGWKRGLASVLLYMLLGIIGLPVFSGFGAGIAKLLGPTGGYIIGFAALCLVYGLIEHVGPKAPWLQPVALLAGLLACYTFGTIWFMHVYTRSNGPISLMATLSMCVFPFILPDIIKLAAAIPVARRIRKAIRSDG